MPFFAGKPPLNKKREAIELAQFYGYEPPQPDPPEYTMDEKFTTDQIEAMRKVIAQHDRAQQPNVFDLSKPPVVPYKHQEFPKLVYDHQKSEAAHDRVTKTALGEERTEHVHVKYVTRTVHNAQELKEALAAGYSEKPPSFAIAEEPGIEAPAKPLEKMNKAELFAFAQQNLVPVDETMTKAQLLVAIQAVDESEAQ